MKIMAPYIITARLLPGLRIAGAFISQEIDGSGRFWIDLKGKEYLVDDLKSPRCRVGRQSDFEQRFAALLDFLCACGESWRIDSEKGENSHLFPPAVAAWAAENSDELAVLCCELEETQTPCFAL
jgi:hypothetical protein